MSSKIKNKSTLDNLNDSFKAAGVILMTAAVTLGLIEVPKDEERRSAIVPVRPVFEFASTGHDQANEPQRREREESGPHYVSYGVAQRSPGRTGRA